MKNDKKQLFFGFLWFIVSLIQQSTPFIMSLSITQYSQRIRLILWMIVLLMPLLLLGAPSLLNIEVLPFSESNVWLTSGWMFLEWLTAPMGDPIQNTSMGAMSFVLLVFLVHSGLIFALFWQVDRLFAHYASSPVFSLGSANRFKWMGCLLIALFVAGGVSSMGLDCLLVNPVMTEADAVTSEYDEVASWFVVLDFGVLLSGLFMCLVAKVMVQGVSLQDDVDATI